VSTPTLHNESVEGTEVFVGVRPFLTNGPRTVQSFLNMAGLQNLLPDLGVCHYYFLCRQAISELDLFLAVADGGL
jgi:hypothetical protein